MNSLNRTSSTFSNKSTKAARSFGGSSCCSDDNVGRVDPLATQAAPSTPTKTTELRLLGLTCTNCKFAVEKAVRDVQGVIQVEVSLALHLAYIEYDRKQVNREKLIDTIEAIGYDVIAEEEEDGNDESSNTTKVVEFTVSGITCTNCTQAIERAFDAVEGINHVTVSLSTNIARVEYDSSRIDIDTLRETIEDIGYDVVDTLIVDEDQDDDGDGGAVSQDRLERLLKQQQMEVSNRKRAFLYSLVGTVPIFVVTMILPYFASSLKWTQFLHKTVKIGHITFVIEALVLWILATPIQFGCGWAFYRSSWYGFRSGILGMDLLVVVGTFFFLRLYGCVFGDGLLCSNIIVMVF